MENEIARARALAGQIQNKLSEFRSTLRILSMTGSSQQRGQAATALTALETASATVDRLVAKLRAGDTTAPRRIAYVGEKTLPAITYIVDELGLEGFLRNLKTLFSDMAATAAKIPSRAGEGAARVLAEGAGGFFKGSPLVFAAVAAVGGLWFYRKVLK